MLGDFGIHRLAFILFARKLGAPWRNVAEDPMRRDVMNSHLDEINRSLDAARVPERAPRDEEDDSEDDDEDYDDE